MKPLQAQAIAQAQQVLLLLFLNSDMTVETACEAVGITERKYRYWLANGETAIEMTRNLIDNQQKQLVSELAIAKNKIINRLIKDATDVTTKPLERAKLFEVLNEELDKLQSVYNVRPGIEEQAQAFLKQGPAIEKKESRFASIDIEETDEGFRIGINKENDIIDGEAKDLQESENSV
ncbi:MAG: hypothetical protein ACP5D6_06450 [Kosmotogaceae bacterium]